MEGGFESAILMACGGTLILCIICMCCTKLAQVRRRRVLLTRHQRRDQRNHRLDSRSPRGPGPANTRFVLRISRIRLFSPVLNPYSRFPETSLEPPAYEEESVQPPPYEQVVSGLLHSSDQSNESINPNCIMGNENEGRNQNETLSSATRNMPSAPPQTPGYYIDNDDVELLVPSDGSNNAPNGRDNEQMIDCEITATHPGFDSPPPYSRM